MHTLLDWLLSHLGLDCIVSQRCSSWVGTNSGGLWLLGEEDTLQEPEASEGHK